jgi:cytochrome P450
MNWTGLDLTDPRVRIDPYAFYRVLRSEDPVHWSRGLNAWLVTRYSDAVEVLRNPEQYSNRGRASSLAARLPESSRALLSPLIESMDRRLVQIDPPDHTRIRSLVNRSFLPRILELIRPRVAAVANALLDRAPLSEPFDVVEHYAFQLPIIVICELLGVDPQDRFRLKQWGDCFAAFLGVSGELEQSAMRALQATREFEAYIKPVIAERRRAPRDDLITLLIRTGHETGNLSDEELVANCIHLITASHETTSFLIGNSVYALLRNPVALQRLRSAPELMPSAVEEFLRYDSPIQKVRRVAVADVSLGDKQIRRGDYVMPLVGAANRDPEHFPDPDALDIERKDNKHLAFGFGIHFCLGAFLARIEGQIALETFLQRLPDIRLHEQPQWKDSIRFRNLKSLWVRAAAHETSP